jgi:hypothetical protein
MDAIQLTCGCCQHAWFYDASRAKLDAAAFDEISRIECPACGKHGVVLTLNLEAPLDQLLEPLPV